MRTEEMAGFAVSPQQQRIFALNPDRRMDPFIAQMTLMIEGVVDRTRLQRALFTLIERHEIFRTSFVTPPGLKIPLQVIAPGTAITMDQVDTQLRHADHSREDFSNLPDLPFTPTGGSLLRCTLVSGRHGASYILLTAPAVCADAQTLKNIARELVDAINVTGTARQTAEDDVIQYADIAEHFNEGLQSESGAVGRQYWHPRVSALTPPTVRSSLYPIRREKAFAPRSVHGRLAGDTLGNARMLLGGDYISNEIFLLVCWQVLLAQVSGDSEFSIGYRADGRGVAELQGCMGLFEKYLPFKTVFSPQSSFRKALHSADETLKEALRWQKSFQWPTPEKFHACCFSYYDATWSFSSNGIRLQCSSVNVCSDRFDLKLSCTLLESSVLLELWYDPAVYIEEEVQQLLDQYLVLVHTAIAFPDVPVTQLSVVGEDERRRLLHEYNAPSLPVSTGSEALIQKIAKQVQKTPQAAALIDERGRLTYEELDRRSNQLAHYLQHHKAGPETRVAICMERSFELVIALLGVWKSGAAYVPLEPQSLPERLAFMIKDSGAEWVLTQDSLRQLLSQDDAQIIGLDGEWEKIGGCNHSAPTGFATDQNLAYVIYTSGSTGKPKGVAVTRGGLSNYVQWACDAYKCGEQGIVPLCSSIGFDLTVTSLWPPLVSGGSALLVPEREGVEALARRQFGHYELVKITPAHLQMLEHLMPPDRAGIAERFVVGGEALYWEQLEYWRRNAPSLRIVNEYGPTETVVGSCIYEISEWQNEGRVPIGRAIANTQVYVLNQWGDLAATGAPGELYIGGVGVARGYLNRPDLTAERFVPNPFTESEGERLYRTGDLVRWRVGGELEYLGRLDDQVKLRGYRIELGEIEAALEQYPHVSQARVVVREQQPGEKSLVGYVVKTEGAALDIVVLQAHLAQRLPEYMLPAAIVQIEQMPMTANGKLDRNALPDPDESKVATSGRGPETLTEELVATIWEQVLRREDITRDASFFELGGHSLLATQVVSRIRSVFDVDLPVRALFEKPTVAGLAEEIDSVRLSQPTTRRPAIQPASRTDTGPLSFAQERLWFIDQMETGTTAYNIMFGLRLRGELNRNALHQSLNSMVRRHQVLRTCFPAPNGVPVQKILAELNIPLEQTDLRHLADDQRRVEIRRLALEVLQQPFDLSSGPLLRAKLLQCADQEHVLVVSLHHIISDGWSTGIMARDLGELYAGYAGGREPVLPELKIQYADYAIWQREWLQGDVLAEQMEYWKTKLAGMQVLQLPTDRIQTPVLPRSGELLVFLLDKELTGKVKELGRREGTTMFMTLLAAFQVLLASYTGQNDIAIGTDIANRNHEEIEGLIGFFVNQLVLRTELRDEINFTDLLKQVRQATFEAYQHQDAPFAKIVEELTSKRNVDANPLFGVKFVFQNAPGEDMVLPGLQIETLEFGQSIAKFDLMLTVSLEEGILSGVFEYRKDLFSQTTIRLLQSQFKQVLTEIVARPEILLGEVKQKLESSRESFRAARQAELKNAAARDLLAARRR